MESLITPTYTSTWRPTGDPDVSPARALLEGWSPLTVVPDSSPPPPRSLIGEPVDLSRSVPEERDTPSKERPRLRPRGNDLADAERVARRRRDEAAMLRDQLAPPAW